MYNYDFISRSTKAYENASLFRFSYEAYENKSFIVNRINQIKTRVSNKLFIVRKKQQFRGNLLNGIEWFTTELHEQTEKRDGAEAVMIGNI